MNYRSCPVSDGSLCGELCRIFLVYEVNRNRKIEKFEILLICIIGFISFNLIKSYLLIMGEKD